MTVRNKETIKTLITILSVLGFLISAYLTHLYYTNANTSYCLSGASCDSVRESSYSSILGVPISPVGIVGYFMIFILTVSTISNRTKWLLLYIISLAGFVFSIYLTYIEFFVINAICSYCVISAIIMTCIFIIVLIKKPLSKIALSKTIPISLLIVLFVVFGSIFFQSKNESGASTDSNLQTALAKHLTRNGAAMYGSYKCAHCLAQKHFFGEAFKYVTYIECHPKAKGSNTSLCIYKGIRNYPTWEINGRFYPGAKPLQELAILSEYSHTE